MNKIIKLSNREFIGLKTEITASHSKNIELIKPLWKKFNAELHKIKNRDVDENWTKFGLIFKKLDRYFYCTAIEYSEEFIIPKSFDQFSLDDFEYYLFEHEGSLDLLKESVNKAFPEIENNDQISFHRDNESGLMMLEKYDKRFNWNSSNSIIDILIPVVRQK